MCAIAVGLPRSPLLTAACARGSSQLLVLTSCDGQLPGAAAAHKPSTRLSKAETHTTSPAPSPACQSCASSVLLCDCPCRSSCNASTPTLVNSSVSCCTKASTPQSLQRSPRRVCPTPHCLLTWTLTAAAVPVAACPSACASCGQLAWHLLCPCPLLPLPLLLYAIEEHATSSTRVDTCVSHSAHAATMCVNDRARRCCHVSTGQVAATAAAVLCCHRRGSLTHLSRVARSPHQVV